MNWLIVATIVTVSELEKSEELVEKLFGRIGLYHEMAETARSAGKEELATYTLDHSRGTTIVATILMEGMKPAASFERGKAYIDVLAGNARQRHKVIIETESLAGLQEEMGECVFFQNSIVAPTIKSV